LAGGKENVCVQCHDAGTAPHQTGLGIRNRITGFAASSEEARSLLQAAEKRGVDVAEARFKLQDAATALVLARNLTHGLSASEIEAALADGSKALAEVRARGEAALKEAKFRRSGLVIATVFILLLAAAVFLKIRDLKTSPKSRG
jgi:hypothetical protein